MSYQYLTKKEIKSIRQKNSKSIADLVSNLKKHENISAQFILIGSGARNMITINNQNNIIDFDYNLKIVKWKNISNLKTINKNEKESLKGIIMENMNKVFKKFNLSYVNDSTSVITTKPFELENKNIKVDLAIICEDNENKIYRLIHEKTGNTHNDEYKFEQIKDIDEKYKEKIISLKKLGKWSEVRAEYLKLKDVYSKDNSNNKRSISIYSEAIANVYNRTNNQNGDNNNY